MRFQNLLLSFALFYTSTAIGQEPPRLSLHSGENVIAMTVQNGTGSPARALWITAEENATPEWLIIHPITVPLSPEEENHEVAFPVIVREAPEGTQGIVPILFTDDAGRMWQIKLNLHIVAAPVIADALLPNAPNPFNPETTITYHLAGENARATTLIVYNALGQQIRTLVNVLQERGIYRVRWDGKDDSGQSVSSGPYFYKLVSGDFTQTHRMLLLK